MKLKLVDKKVEAVGTKSFFFDPSEKIEFLPGQYFYITLPKLNYKDTRGPVRQFTISSSPTEGSLLRITMRIRPLSGFKKTLDETPLGSLVQTEGPNGVFIFNPLSKNSHVFIAGGIGITPFRSILKSHIDNGSKLPTQLIYSNTGSEFVFKDELDFWATNNKWFSITYHDTEISGRLNEEVLKKVLSENKNQKTEYWLSGPPSFVSTMEEILNKNNISPELIHLDKFTGY